MKNLKDLLNIKSLKNNLNSNNPWTLKISWNDKIMFFDSLFNLIESGIPMLNAMNIMLLQTKNKKIKFILENTIKEMWKWKKLQDCFSKYTNIFTNFDIYIIKMWEVTWKIAQSFDIIKTESWKNADLRQKIVWALIYPAIIVLLSTTMIIWFMVFVIPRVEWMYKDAKANLPGLTQSVIDLSHFITDNYAILIIMIMILILSIMMLKKSPKVMYNFDKYILNLPIFWEIFRKKILIIFSNTLWSLLSNWILINESLNITKKTIWNLYYEKKIEEIEAWIWEWLSLSKLMWIDKISSWIEDPYFPIELTSIVKIWEQTWKLSSLLQKISYKYTKELDNLIKNLSTAIEPVVIIVVWSIVWTMILAILLPFFNMVNVM